MNQLPFQQPGRFYRGNLHSHSTYSDGVLSPEEVATAYRLSGYDFVAITDHFLERFGFPVTDTTGLRCSDFTTLIGAELHAPALENGENWHILAVGLPLDFAATSPEEGASALATRARDAGAFVAIAHPHWYNITMADARSIAAAHAVEVHNETAAVYNDRADGWYLADLLFMEGRRILSIGTDDAHCRTERPDMFGAWVMVRSESLDQDSLLAALKAGHFYTSQGPQIHDISIDKQKSRISIACTPARSIIVSGRAQRARDLHGHSLRHAEFSLEPFEGGHCRVTIVGQDGKRAWSNAIWLD